MSQSGLLLKVDEFVLQGAGPIDFRDGDLFGFTGRKPKDFELEGVAFDLGVVVSPAAEGRRLLGGVPVLRSSVLNNIKARN